MLVRAHGDDSSRILKVARRHPLPLARGLPIFGDMKVREAGLQAIAGAIVDAMLRQGFVHPKQDAAVLQQRIVQLIADNLAAEQRLEEEAEQLAAAHARQMAGMDQRKIIQGIKERLARERGFSL